MRITVLMGSPRKKDSYRICQIIEENMSHTANVTFDYLFLKDLNIEDCKGCDQCFKKSESFCPCQDDLPEVKEKLLQADGIIFVSPVYACQVTGLMKRTLDRLSYLFHRQELVGKPAITISTTGGGGLKPTGNYLKMTASGWGCSLAGEIRIVSPMFFESKHAAESFGYNEKYHSAQAEKIKQVSDRFLQAVINPHPPVPSFYDIYMFQCLRSKTFISKADYDFWEERGWINGDFFYKVNLNPVKKLFGKLMKSCVDAAARRILGDRRRCP